MDFPEGTVFQNLREIGLAGQERRNAASTHILRKTMGNGILTATLGNAPRWSFWGLHRASWAQVQPHAHFQSRA